MVGISFFRKTYRWKAELIFTVFIVLFLFFPWVSFGAIEHVQDFSNVASTGNPLTATTSVNVTAGNTLVVYARQSSSAARTYTISDNLEGASGWVKIIATSTAGREVNIWYKHNVSPDITLVTVTNSNATGAFEMTASEFTGFGTTVSVVATSSRTDNATSRGVHHASVTGITASEQVLSVVVGQTTATFTDGVPGVGYTEVPDGAVGNSGIFQRGVFEAASTTQEAWNIRNTIYDDISTSTNAQDASPQEVTFSPDGTYMYVAGSTGGGIYQYTLGVPWDISTATSTASTSVTAQESTPLGVYMSATGTRMWVIGSGSDRVIQYDLSVAWDVTSKSFSNASTSVSAQDSSPSAIAFSQDGMKMYIHGNTNQDIFQYSLTSSFDLSGGVTYDTISTTTNNQDTGATGMAFHASGTKVYIVGITTDRIYEYTLSTPWDVSTMVYSERYYAISTQDTTATGVYFRPDGLKLYMTGNTNDRVFQYSVIAEAGIWTNTGTQRIAITGMAFLGGSADTDIAVSGTLYSDAGVTPLTATRTIGVAIGAPTPQVYYGVSSTTGSWSVAVPTSTISTGTPIVIWVDGSTTTRATLVTKASTTSNGITGLDLYQNRVVVSHEDLTGTSTTLTEFLTYDGRDDSSIPFTATTTVTATTSSGITVSAGTQLYVKEGKHFAPGARVTVRGNASSTDVLDGSLHLATTSTYTAGLSTMLAGNLTAASSSVFVHSNGTLLFNASTTGKVVDTWFTEYGNLYFTGSSSTYTISNPATTSRLYIGTNATVTAPSLLTILGDYVNGGGFVHNSGTVRFASSTTQNAMGSTGTSSAFGTLRIDAGSVAFAGEIIARVATTVTSLDMNALTIDTSNGTLYAGAANGIIFRCALSTGCDSAGDFITANDTAATTIYSLAIDGTNQTLYAGSGSGGIIYRCALSTGCDSAGDFTTATDTVASRIYSLTIDSTNGTLYAGTNSSDGIIFRCALSTGCDSTGDFTTMNYTEGQMTNDIYSLTIDSTNGTLYFGTVARINGGIYALCAICSINEDGVTVTGNLSVADGATLTQNEEMRISGNYSNSGTSTANTETASPQMVFTGSSAQTIAGILTGTSSLPRVVFTGAGTKTFLNNASTTGFIIGAGTQVVAPAGLTVQIRVENAGTFDANGGVLYIPSGRVEGDFVNTNAFNTLTIGGGDGLFTSVLGNEYYDSAYDIAVDDTAVYVAGECYDCGSLGHYAYYITVYDKTDSSLLWSTTTDPTVGSDSAYGIAVDDTAVYVAGYCTSCGALGGTAYHTIAYDKTDASFLWATTTDPTVGNDSAYGIAVDDTAVYVAGYCTSCGALGGTAYHTIAYDKTDASFLWATTTDATTTNEYVYSIAVDDTAVYVTGELGSRDGVNTIAYDKTDASFLWATTTYSSVGGNDEAYSIAVDDGAVYVVGLLYIGGNDDAYHTIAYDKTDASFLWATTTNPSTGNQGYDNPYGIAVDANTVYVTGYCSDCYDDDTPDRYTVAYDKYSGGAALGTVILSSNASTTDLTIQDNRVLSAPQALTISGDYSNSGLFDNSLGGTTTFSGSGAQTLSGSLTSTSSFAHLEFAGAGTKTLNNNASTSNFLIQSGSGAVTAPTSLTIGGHFTNNGTFTANGGTTTISSSTAQTISGIATGTSAFSTLILTGTSTKTFANNASTTNLSIETGATAVLPSLFSLTGNYTNNGTTTAGSGTTTFNGTTAQNATGTMTGTSAFNNLAITNTSGQGSSTQSVIFGARASTTGTLFMRASTSAAFAAGATSTFQNIYFQGSSTGRAYLRSTASNTPWNLVVPGTQQLVSYVDVRDSQACSGNPDISAVYGTSVDAGGNTCWDFGSSLTLSSENNQVFTYGESTTTLATITITDNEGLITATNDIRIKISTSTLAMRFDTYDTEVTLGGTASAKASSTVTYEGDGSVLVIPVGVDFSASETLTISGISVGAFLGTSTARNALAIYTDGAGDIIANDTDDKTIGISGSLTLGNHTLGQVTDNFDLVSASDVELFAFTLTPGGESATVSSLTFVSNIVNNVLTTDLTNVRLYRDQNSDGLYDASDTQIGGGGSVDITGRSGTITFSISFDATTTQNYILVADTANMYGGDMIYVTLPREQISATGALTALAIDVTGESSGITHRKGGVSEGGGYGEVGGAAPEGGGVTTGGGNDAGDGEAGNSDSGDSIGSEPGFNAPSSNSGSFTNGGNAYASDGAYATTTATLTHTYGTYSFNMPGNNTITGIEVKLEGSASTNAGTFSARISWDNGSSYTDLKTTGTLTTSDAVYSLGGQGDTWGHSFTPAETENGTFLLELTGTPSSNAVSLDALQVKIYHQASGGNNGGGGGEVLIPSNRYFANVITGFGSLWKTVSFDTPLLGWIMNIFR